MRTTICLLAAVSLSLTGCGKSDPLPPPSSTSTVEDDLKFMAGKWGVDKIDTVGEQVPPKDAFDTVVIEIKGNSAVVLENGRNSTGIIRLDPTKFPKELDITRADKHGKQLEAGPDETPEIVKGIYKIEGEAVVVAFSAPNRPRPGEFKPTAREKDNQYNGVLVVTFKKLSDADVARMADAPNAAMNKIKILKARHEMFILETACKNYILKSGGMPPPTLFDLITPPGGRPLIESEKLLIDPWNYHYQYDANNTSNGIDPDPLVFTFHPETKKKLTARDKD